MTTTTPRTTTTTGRTMRTAVAALALTALVGACANNPSTTAGTGSTDATPAAPVTTAVASGTATAGALLSTSSAGDILVGSDGRALYGFTNDIEALSTCYSTCAEAWPPVIVSPEWTVGPGLDTGIFATTERDDGQLQLVAGRWPLYYYTGDAVSGDINGQGSGDVWFLVDPGGRLVTGASEPGDGAAAGPAGDGYAAGPTGDSGDDGDRSGTTNDLVGKAATDLGTVLTDEAGLTLYGFTADLDQEPSCYDACAQAWPPVLVDGAELPDGLDPEIYSVVERNDGTWQLAAGDWPLYRFGGDGAKGDLNGQGSGGKWFATAPDGTLIRS